MAGLIEEVVGRVVGGPQRPTGKSFPVASCGPQHTHLTAEGLLCRSASHWPVKV